MLATTVKVLPTGDAKSNYWISNKGHIYRIDDQPVKIEPFEKDNELWVGIVIENEIKFWRLAALIAVCYCDIKISPKLWNRIVPIYRNNKPTDVSSENVIYSFDGPLEDPLNVGYYIVPFYTTFAISSVGEIISRFNKRVRTWTLISSQRNKNIKGSYRVTNGYHDIKGKVTNCSRHRSMCLVFNRYFVDPLPMVVNHKDGIPGNDVPTNLELVTYSANSKHAFETNLHPEQVVAVKYKNWITGAEASFHSVVKASKALGMDCSTIHRRLASDKKSLRFKDGHRFKLDDDLPWCELDSATINIQTSRTIIAYNVFTKTIKEYGSESIAAEDTKINGRTIGNFIRRNQTRPINGFIFRNKNDNPIFPNFTERQLDCFKEHPMHSPIPIIAKHVVTGEELFFTSPEKAGEHFQLNKGHITKMARWKKCVKGYALEQLQLTDK